MDFCKNRQNGDGGYFYGFLGGVWGVFGRLGSRKGVVKGSKKPHFDPILTDRGFSKPRFSLFKKKW